VTSSTNSSQSAVTPEVIQGALLNSPAFRTLGAEQQAELSHSMTKVFGYLAHSPEAPARQLAPDLNALRRGAGRGDDSGTAMPAPGGGAVQPGAGQPRPGGQGAVDRAAGAAAAMLGAIDFPGFVASLVQGTFQAIVDASIQQMEAYSTLLQETAKTVDDFMADNVTDDMARDHLADTYGDVFRRDLSTGQPQLQVDSSRVGAGQLPTFLKDLGFDSPMDIDDQSVEEVIVPETRRTLAEMRHQTLATMVMMGINRVVVDDGEINAKLIFHVAATEAMTLTFEEHKPTNWTLAGQLGRNAFGASGIMVQTTNLNAQSDLNVRADLTGEVKVRFRSETFPLERFADSAAIQLINTRARVPETRPQPAVSTGTGEGAPANGTSVEQALGAARAVLPAPRSFNASRPGSDPWLPGNKS